MVLGDQRAAPRRHRNAVIDDSVDMRVSSTVLSPRQRAANDLLAQRYPKTWLQVERFGN